MNKDFLVKLRESAEFRHIMGEVLAYRPVVPQWRPCTSVDDAQHLTDEIKLATGKRMGFDTLHAILSGKEPGNE